ncbi:uncharacterized protein LOC127879777 [Dreissena polymorpha]|uniref:ATR-interacting protein n=1 Tax=Dreissena polymorpha TaxID=45954 RepID=A0A9D4RWE5_DREPO|nr:uncharacterized protein LOC127879777 [Dreissena polymorpha]KAH3881338.1 hypothetical protein DPMN_005263 [Dreissena polymorpha]
MAAKSVLTCLGWRKGKYSLDTEVVGPFGVKTNMAGNYRKPSSGEPPLKKPRTGEGKEDEGLWDDSMEFTQADLGDLEDLEMQASQAIRHDPPQPETVGPTVPAASSVSQPRSRASQAPVPSRPQSSGGFLKPQLSRSSSSVSSHTGSHNTSRSSGSRSNNASSLTGSHSSNTSYPSSLSDYSSTSIRSGSSLDSLPGQQQSGALVHRLSFESPDVPGNLQPATQGTTAELSRFKQQIAALQLQLERQKEEMLLKEGMIQLLRDNMKTKDCELDGLKRDKISSIHQQNQQQTEKEKHLQTELGRLQTQLQFKDQEGRELSVRCRELEGQLTSLQATPASSQAFISSPKCRRILVEQSVLKSHEFPKGKGPAFPSKQTFLSAEVSPVKKSPVTESRSHVVGASGDHDIGSHDNNKNRLKNKERKDRGLICRSGLKNLSTGSRLVARLLQVPADMTGSVQNRGIVGLLNMPRSSTSLQNMQFDRDRDTSLLSPVRTQRLADFQNIVHKVEQTELTSLVPVSHFNMAIQGLTKLLAGNQTVAKNSTHSSNSSEDSSAVGSPDRSKFGDQSEATRLENSIFLLPIINDYLGHYIEMIELTLLESSAISTSSTSNTSSSSPDSLETSGPSPTGSVAQFLKNSASFANDLEGYCIAALRVLHELVGCCHIREVLMQKENGAEQEPNMEVEVQIPQEAPSSRLIVRSSNLPYQYVVKLHLLHKVLKLSNPGTKGLYNVKVVGLCLQIVGRLALHAEEHQITSLLPLVSEESLQRCLECDRDPQVIIEALHVFKAIARSNQFVAMLCSRSTGCLMLALYGLCSPTKMLVHPEITQLKLAKLILEALNHLLSCHEGILTILLESNCQCSVGFVTSIVHLLYSVMMIFNNQSYLANYSELSRHGTCDASVKNEDAQTLKDMSLRVLQTGLHLLHLMSLLDSSFYNRHQPVQHYYVLLVCGLVQIFKPLKKNNEAEMNALQDLWDFNQDDSELSHDSEEHENMDQS